MENIIRKRTEVTPEINFNAETRQMNLTGRCIPENAFNLFMPLADWITNLFDGSHAGKTEEYTLTIDCDYYNSASAKMLVFLLGKLAEIQKAGYRLKVIWLFDSEDTDLAESVRDYTEITGARIDLMTK